MVDITLYHGDCLKILPTLESQSVDCVISDPPYPEIDREYGRMTESAWMEMMKCVVMETRRILKPSGSAVFVLQPNSEKVGKMRLWLWRFMVWAGEYWNIIQDAYWWNTATQPGAHTKRTVGLMRPSVKACIWIGDTNCYRGQDFVLWEESQETTARRLSGRALERMDRKYKPSGWSQSEGQMLKTPLERGGVTPFNILPIPNTNSLSSAGANGHGAGTPLKLCDWWTRYICPKGGTVLDPFFGSGTTGLAAIKNQCSIIGIEKMDKYVEIADRRLREEINKQPLFANQVTFSTLSMV